MSVLQETATFWYSMESAGTVSEMVENSDQKYESDSSSEFELIDDENKPKPKITITECDGSNSKEKVDEEKKTEQMINSIIAELEKCPEIVDNSSAESEMPDLEETQPLKAEELPPKKDESLAHNILKQIQPKINNNENVFIKFTNYGTWVNYDDKKVDWLKSGFHLKSETFYFQSWSQIDCPCKQRKFEEDQKKKMIEALRKKIENRQSFAMVFTGNKSAKIYDVNNTDIKWIDYINFQMSSGRSFSGFGERNRVQVYASAFFNLYYNNLFAGSSKNQTVAEIALRKTARNVLSYFIFFGITTMLLSAILCVRKALL